MSVLDRRPDRRPRRRTGLRLARIVVPVGFLAAAPFLTTSSPAATLPTAMLETYLDAAQRADCAVPPALLLAIGEAESRHGTVSATDDLIRGEAAGTSRYPVSEPAILGPRLDGSNGVARVDADGDGVAGGEGDRARGLMQILPSTAAELGINDPDMLQDVRVAVSVAAAYLCRAGVDADIRRAVLAYNPSATYADAVLASMRTYEALLTR